MNSIIEKQSQKYNAMRVLSASTDYINFVEIKFSDGSVHKLTMETWAIMREVYEKIFFAFICI